MLQAIDSKRSSTVYYAEDYRNHEYAIELFKETGVKTIKVTLDYLAFDTNYQEKQKLIERLYAELDKNNADGEIQVLKKEVERLFLN